MEQQEEMGELEQQEQQWKFVQWMEVWGMCFEKWMRKKERKEQCEDELKV